MRNMEGCKYFKCNGCNDYKSIEQQNVEKVAITQFSHKSDLSLIYKVYHIQMCNDCKKNALKK